tara:strand:- start:70672 stop:72243 length:1572 start_codon:yes stop_codon:yes gene_type:complete
MFRIRQIDPSNDAFFIATTCLVILALQLIVYFNHPINPILASDGIGWGHWYDQGQYLRSAQALAQAQLSPQDHWYPIGYALLAAPFSFLGFSEPFIFVNAAGLCFYAYGFMRLFMPYMNRLLAFAALVLALIIPFTTSQPHPMLFPVLTQFTVPWNSVPVAAAFLWIVVFIRDLQNHDDVWKNAALGGLAALVISNRPGDIATLLPAGCFYLWSLRQTERPLLRIIQAVCAAALVAAPVLVLQLVIHGGLSSPYTKLSADIGFDLGNLATRAYWIFIDAVPAWNEPYSLFKLQPWLYLAVPLSLTWAILKPRAGLLLLLLAITSNIFYLSYNDWTPFSFIRYQLIHYIAWTLPVFLAAGIAGTRLLFVEKHWLTLFIAGFLVPLLLLSLNTQRQVISFDDLSIEKPDDGRSRYTLNFATMLKIDAIDLPGSSANGDILLLNRQFALEGDGKPISMFPGYRTIEIPGGIRIVFFKNMTVRQIRFTLDQQVDNHPQDISDVQPVSFTIALDWPWRRSGAALTSPQ